MIAALSLLAPLSAQTPAGSVQGRISNAVTGNSLYNALITVEGTTNTTLSSANGEYQFSNLPAGEVRLRVIYAGMEGQIATVKIAPATVPSRISPSRWPAAGGFIPRTPCGWKNFGRGVTVLSAPPPVDEQNNRSEHQERHCTRADLATWATANIGEYLMLHARGSDSRRPRSIWSPSSPGTASIRGMPPAGLCSWKMVSGVCPDH